MNAIANLFKRPLAPLWKWRDRYAQFHSPGEMTTQHLFFTLRMIWNHRMPLPARIPYCRVYDFHPYYTDDYLKEAIIHLTTELGKRDNMTPVWKGELQHMIDWLKVNQIPATKEKRNASIT